MKLLIIPLEQLHIGAVVTAADPAKWHVLLPGQSWAEIPIERRRSWLIRTHLN